MARPPYAPFFFGKLRRYVQVYKDLCINKAAEYRKEEEQLRRRLQESVTNLQANPENDHWQEMAASCTDGLQKFEKRKVEGQLLRSRIKWKQVGDQCSKEFFQATREKSSTSHITELTNNHGVAHTSQVALQYISQKYYGDWYRARQGSPTTPGAKFQSLRPIQDKLIPEMKNKLKAPMQLGELQTALGEMCMEKSPGPDGVVLEFYREFWKLIGPEFLEIIKTSIHNGRLPPGVTTGMLALLHKGGLRTALSNWRSITLLNLSYKIYTKALQLCLQPVLMEIVSWEQSAFLPLRFILDNILLTQETIAWAEQSGQDLLFLKLDFSKAFDMVDWNFLFDTMATMGFPRDFRGMVQLLFKYAKAWMKVNGSLSESFSIEREVR
jgi:hypothetical protein